MWESIKKNPVAAIAALLAHLIFIAILVVSFNFSDDEGVNQEPRHIELVKANAVDEKQVNAEIKRIRDAEKRKQEKLDAKVKKAKDARLREERKLKELKKKRQTEERKRKQKAIADKKHLAEVKKKRKKLELKRKKEEKRLAELEQKRKQEEERIRQQEQAKQEVEMKGKLEAERQKREAASHRANQSEVKKFQGLIKQEVSRHWIVPNLNVKNLSCDVKVRIIPGGGVLDVKIIKSSGNRAFDRSVEAAVYKAAPLPVPTVESGLFNEFREVIFSFEPKNLAEFD